MIQLNDLSEELTDVMDGDLRLIVGGSSTHPTLWGSVGSITPPTQDCFNTPNAFLGIRPCIWDSLRKVKY